MKLVVYFILAFIIPCVLCERCECEFASQWYTGTFDLRKTVNVNGKHQLVEDAKGTFHVDVHGYYFRATFNLPSEGRMYFYKDNNTELVCYKNSGHCRNEKLTFAFPRCIPHPSGFDKLNNVYFFSTVIDGTRYSALYFTAPPQNGICKPLRISWGDSGNYDTQVMSYGYHDLSVDVSRDKSFYREDIRDFDLNSDENLG